MNKEFIAALDQLEKEKSIPKAQILEAVKHALVSAYKLRNKSSEENVFVEIDEHTGNIEVFHRKTVVETVEDPEIEVSLEEMREFDSGYEIGDVAEFEFPVEDFTRIAAQTAKQVVVQAIRDAERGMIYDEYKDRQGELVTGTVQRMGNGTVYVTVGRTEGVLPVNEQVRGERYVPNSRMKFYIVEVRDSQKGPQIFLSRSHPSLVKKLFELEVPEIRDGIVSVASLAREAGSRSKIAVASSDDSVDPVGACVGSRGNRVQAVVEELLDEKIDIVPWCDSTVTNIMSALAPAQVEKVVYNEEERRSIAIVPDFQLSLAIGKEGQNVRLAARLCGVKIDIKSHTQYYSSEEDIRLVADADLTGVEYDEEGYMIVNDAPAGAPEYGADEGYEGEPEEEYLEVPDNDSDDAAGAGEDEPEEEYLEVPDNDNDGDDDKGAAGADGEDGEPEEEYLEVPDNDNDGDIMEGVSESEGEDD